MPFHDDVVEPSDRVHDARSSMGLSPTVERDIVTAALELVARMAPAELAAFRVHMQFPVRLVGAERPAALAAMHAPEDLAGDT